MGATTTLLYGVNLLMTPVYDPIPIEEGSAPEVAKIDHRYQIRVLVPCYKESLELVQRTVTAALDAQLPKGCKWWGSCFLSLGEGLMQGHIFMRSRPVPHSSLLEAQASG